MFVHPSNHHRGDIGEFAHSQPARFGDLKQSSLRCHGSGKAVIGFEPDQRSAASIVAAKNLSLLSRYMSDASKLLSSIDDSWPRAFT